MTEFFQAFVDGARKLAAANNLSWELPVGLDGSVPKQHAWDLTVLAGAVPPPRLRLSDLGSDTSTLAVLNTRRAASDLPPMAAFALPQSWQDLVKAVVLYQIVVDQNSVAHVSGQVARPLRVLATCVAARSGAEPWDLVADDIRHARDVAVAVQASGTLGSHVEGVIRGVLDALHLCLNGPFAHVLPKRVYSNPYGLIQIRGSLEQRRSEAKLPGTDELWCLVDIVFTAAPRTFADKLRFALLRVMLLCGFRVREACSIPLDWKRFHEHVDLNGRPAGDIGGVSRTISLRHFAAKQQDRDDDSALLFETMQHIPTQFEDIIVQTLEEVRVMTAPLRERLRAQAEAGRLFPEFTPDTLLPLSDAYTRLTGNPLCTQEAVETEIAAYLRTFGSEEMEAIRAKQRTGMPFRIPFHKFWMLWEENDGPPLLGADGGSRKIGKRRPADLYLRVGDLEEYVATRTPTKMSDMTPLPLAEGGSLPAHDLLFLMPKRALMEGRNDGACDVWRYLSVGRVTPDLFNGKQLSSGTKSIFHRYGRTDAERAYSLNTHALRHLQNGELFRMGVSDAAITKRFDRRSVTQSHVYDHRSLAEELQAMSLPPEAEVLPPKARIVAQMIQAGRGRGRVVDEFKGILRDRGAEEAYSFLAAEADGFHVTPYGFCVNGFTQEPCPKHLQCANGCNRLVSTGVDRHRENLETLERRTAIAVETIEARKVGIGRDNQLAHARTVLANVRVILETPNGEAPFPDGPDLSRIVEGRTVLDA